MNINYKNKPKGRWWDISPPVLTPTALMLPFRATQDSELEKLKFRLLKNELEAVDNSTLSALLRRAANESASLAWSTHYPLLVFPALFEEKLKEARNQHVMQEKIRSKSLSFSSLNA